MQENLSVGQTVPVIGAAAIGGDPTITQAALSVQVYTSSDQSVFTVVPDTTTAGGAIITAIANGTATLLETATATEADGTSHQVQGVATIVIAPAVVIVPPADGIVFTFGTPSGL